MVRAVDGFPAQDGRRSGGDKAIARVHSRGRVAGRELVDGGVDARLPDKGHGIRYGVAVFDGDDFPIIDLPVHQVAKRVFQRGCGGLTGGGDAKADDLKLRLADGQLIGVGIAKGCRPGFLNDIAVRGVPDKDRVGDGAVGVDGQSLGVGDRSMVPDRPGWAAA